MKKSTIDDVFVLLRDLKSEIDQIRVRVKRLALYG